MVQKKVISSLISVFKWLSSQLSANRGPQGLCEPEGNSVATKIQQEQDTDGHRGQLNHLLALDGLVSTPHGTEKDSDLYFL